MYKCPSYYDNNNILQDCECGECGTLNDIHYKGKPLQRIEPILKQAQIYEEDIETNSQAIMDRIARSDKWEKKS